MNDHGNTLHGRGTGAGPEFGPGYVLAGNYELLQPIGRGGMGQVWQARDRAGRRDVAVKLLPPELRDQEDAVEQVRASFQKTHSLTHQHIGKTLAMLDDTAAGPFIVMDLVPGLPLSRYAAQLRQQAGALTLERVVELLRPVAVALDFAHLKGVLHQDVKPQNVLVQVGPPLEVTLIDFGIAATIRGSMTRYTNVSPDTAGTRPYMSPERLRGKKKEWDGRSDQYALAVMAYELLSGDPPFVQDGDDFAFMYAVLNEPVDLLVSLSATGNAALVKALAKSRDDRFGSCLEFVEALAVITPPPPPVKATSAPSPAPPPTPPPAPPPVRSSPPVTGPAPPARRAALTRMIAPFDAKAAAAGQAACANELGIPVEFTNSIGMKFRLIPPGEFSMDGKEYPDAQPIHRVTLTKPYYVGVFPVTQGEYERVMGVNPSRFRGDARRPVEHVSWHDAQEFIKRLSGDEPNHTYRLATEAEWEYACRAGSPHAYCFGDDERLLGEYAWYDANSGGTTHPVGTKKANGWGLHDMHGNVWEWCQDGKRDYTAAEVIDPVGPDNVGSRCIRGGSWINLARSVRCACRNRYRAGDQDDSLGFRLVRVQDAS